MSWGRGEGCARREIVALLRNPANTFRCEADHRQAGWEQLGRALPGRRLYLAMIAIPLTPLCSWLMEESLFADGEQKCLQPEVRRNANQLFLHDFQQLYRIDICVLPA